MKKQYSLLTLVTLFLFLTFSCVDNLDFNQIDNFEATPIIKAALVNFKTNQTAFLDPSNNEVNEINDTTDFIVFNNLVAKDYLVKVAIEIKVSNTFNRTFEIDFLFLDNNGNTTYQISSLVISPNSNNFTHTEEIIVENNQAFLQSSKIRSTIKLIPSNNGAILNPNEAQEIQFQSAGNFHLKIN